MDKLVKVHHVWNYSGTKSFVYLFARSTGKQTYDSMTKEGLQALGTGEGVLKVEFPLMVALDSTSYIKQPYKQKLQIMETKKSLYFR